MVRHTPDAHPCSCLTIGGAVGRRGQAVSDRSGALVRLRAGMRMRILERVLAARMRRDADTA